MLNPASFKTTSALADLSVKFANEMSAFIALQVLPAAYVPKAQFKWYQYDKANLRRVDSKTDSKAPANLIDYGAFTKSGTALLHKLAAEVDPADERDADAPVSNMELDATQNVMQMLLIDLEKEVSDKIGLSTNYPSALTSALAAGDTWADAAGDPIEDARVARSAVKDSCGRAANVLAISWTTFEYLKIHPAIIDRIKFTGGQTPTKEAIANLLGVKEIIISEAQYNNAAEGATDNLDDIWGDFALFFYRNPAATGNETRGVTFGRTFFVQELYTRVDEDKRRGAKERIKLLESGWWYTPEFVAVQSSSDGDTCAGYLFTNTY